jgi:hypothetical protein
VAPAIDGGIVNENCIPVRLANDRAFATKSQLICWPPIFYGAAQYCQPRSRRLARFPIAWNYAIDQKLRDAGPHAPQIQLTLGHE